MQTKLKIHGIPKSEDWLRQGLFIGKYSVVKILLPTP